MSFSPSSAVTLTSRRDKKKMMATPTCKLTGELVCKCAYERPWLEAAERDFRDTLRSLFSDHGNYTVFVIRGVIDGGGKDVETNTRRLLANQVEIGAAVGLFVSNKPDKELGALLTKHIQLAAEAVTAATALKVKCVGTACGVAAAQKALFLNAEEVATYISKATGYRLPLVDSIQMWRIHIELLLDMVKARLGGQYDSEQIHYDAYTREIIAMANAIYDGLVAVVEVIDVIDWDFKKKIIKCVFQREMEHVVDDKTEAEIEEEENDKGLFLAVVDNPKGRLFLMTMSVCSLVLIAMMNGDFVSFCLIIVAMLVTTGLMYYIVMHYTTLRPSEVWKDLAGLKRD